jgi:hypothetical protein
MVQANNDIIPIWNTDRAIVALDTDYLGNKPQIIVSINGVAGYRMVIDSGASFTFLIDTPKVRALALTSDFDLSLGGIGDEQRSPAFKTKVASLSLGKVDLKDFSVAFMPVTTTSYYMVAEEAIVDGIIGYDVLRHFIWKFDRPNNQVSLSKSAEAYAVSGDAIVLDAKISFTRFLVNADMDFGNNQIVNKDIIIDTGSRNYLNVNGTYLTNNDIINSQASYQSADFGLSGMSLKERTTIDKLKFSNAVFKNVRTNISKTDDEDDMWYVGSALFRQFSLILDYPNERVLLDGFNNSLYHSRYNLLGLELRKLSNGNFIIKYIMPKSAAATKVFAVGQEIISINRQHSQQITLEDWLQLTSEPGVYEICINEALKCYTIESDD